MTRGRFRSNKEALVNLYRSVSAEPGVRYVHQTQPTIAPTVPEPSLIEDLSPYAVDKSRKRHPASTHSDKRYASVIIGLETGSVNLFKKYMPGKSYPFRPEQWPDAVLKGMEILNRNNWFPFCTWILGLPGETDADTRESLDLLHAMKGSKWCVVPTLFTPLEDTRLASQRAAKLPQLTELQWELFFTCWRYNLDFFHHNRKWLMFYLGTPIYYFLLRRKMFGKNIKYPLWRMAHVPESLLRRRLYLDLDAPATRFKMKSPALVPLQLRRTLRKS